MKEAEKIINGIKYWSDGDQKNRTAVVILTDKKEGDVWSLSTGTTREIGLLIYSLMTEKKELGHDIYVAACLYAHNYIAAKECDKINAAISAAAEASKKIDAFISAAAEARKKTERRREMRYRIRPRIYACFTHSDRIPIVQSSITTYAVQVRKWYGWVTVKEYDEGSDSDFALSQAEELLEFLNQ